MYIITRKHYIQERHYDGYEERPVMVDAYAIAAFHTMDSVNKYFETAPADEILKLKPSGLTWRLIEKTATTATISTDWDGAYRYIRKFEAVWVEEET